MTAGSLVTTAEYIAAKQVLAGEGRTLTLDKNGTAKSGLVDLDAITGEGDVMLARGLVVSREVTAYGDFGRRSDFRLLGDLDNYGTVVAHSSDDTVGGGTLAP